MTSIASWVMMVVATGSFDSTLTTWSKKTLFLCSTKLTQRWSRLHKTFTNSSASVISCFLHSTERYSTVLLSLWTASRLLRDCSLAFFNTLVLLGCCHWYSSIKGRVRVSREGNPDTTATCLQLLPPFSPREVRIAPPFSSLLCWRRRRRGCVVYPIYHLLLGFAVVVVVVVVVPLHKR